MAKKTNPKNNPANPSSESVINYASKPRLIGAVIKNIVDQKRLDEQEIADRMNRTLHTMRTWYKMEYLPVPIMMELSPLLGENLIAHYHPDIKPAPDPCAALQRQIDALKQEMKMMDEDAAKAKVEIIRLEAKIELLMEQLEEERKRKIIR